MGFDEVETYSRLRTYVDTIKDLSIGTSWTNGGLLLEGWHTTTVTYTSLYLPLTVTYNPCTPYMSIPTQLLSIDQRWVTCTRNFRRLYDPPSVLDTASRFSLVTTVNPASTTPTRPNRASAAPTIQQPAATNTPAPKTKPTYSQNDDPLLAVQSQAISKLPASITLGKDISKANSGEEFVIDSQTLTPGGKITNANKVLSMATDGHALIIDSSTMYLEPPYAVGTQTLILGGPAVTVGNTVLILGPGSGDGEESLVVASYHPRSSKRMMLLTSS